MKKNIVAVFVLFCFTFIAYATEENSMLPAVSAGAIIGNYFQLVLIIIISLLVLFAIILGIEHFFKKDVENKKGLPTSDIGMAVKLIIPFAIFVVIFVFSIFSRGFVMCDCFENYSIFVGIVMAIVFFIGSLWLMKKNKKEWKILYTLLFIISFLIAFYSIMAIGEYFYVADGFWILSLV